MKAILMLSIILLGTFNVRNLDAKNHLPETTFQNRDNDRKDTTTFHLKYHLKSKKGITIGSLFVKPSMENKEIFSSLIIRGFGEHINDTLYSINGNIFRNTKGVDIKVFGENHYGYQFIKKTETSFVIISLNDCGKSVSDDIWIKWNEGKGVFEVEKEP